MKTDLELKQDVLNELKWEPSIDATNIGVIVKEGIVILNGNLNTRKLKWRVMRISPDEKLRSKTISTVRP